MLASLCAHVVLPFAGAMLDADTLFVSGVHWAPMAVVSFALTADAPLAAAVVQRAAQAVLLLVAAFLFGLEVASIVQRPLATCVWALAGTSVAIAPLVGAWRRATPAQRIDWVNRGPREWHVVFPCACAIGALLGMWMSCYVVPLDLNEPWQLWPLPALCGCYIGHTLGLVCAACAYAAHELRF